MATSFGSIPFFFLFPSCFFFLFVPLPFFSGFLDSLLLIVLKLNHALLERIERFRRIIQSKREKREKKEGKRKREKGIGPVILIDPV